MPPSPKAQPKSKPGAKANRTATTDGWCVYMLRCADGSLYTGCTNDLTQRVDRHNAGRGAAYTRSRLPVVLVFEEPAADRSAALKREAALKRLTRAQKLELVGASGATRKRPRKQAARSKRA